MTEPSRKVVLVGIGVGALFGALMSLLAALDGVSQNTIPGGAIVGMPAAYFVLYVRWEISRPSRSRRPIHMSNRLRPVLLMASGAFGLVSVFLFDSYFVAMSIFWISTILIFSGMLEAFYRVLRLR